MNEPLAQRMRPKTLAEVCGQQHLLAPGRVFRQVDRERTYPQHRSSMVLLARARPP